MKSGSRMVTEFRSATTAVVASLLNEVNELRMNWNLDPINITHLDFKLWLMGRRDKTSRSAVVQTSNF